VPKLRLLLDNDVPEGVGKVFRHHGHDVTQVRDILPVNSPDQLVAAVSELDGMILVSCDSDFRLVAPRIPKGHRARFRKLSRISIECSQVQAEQRTDEAMRLIEMEYEDAQNRRDKRMIIVIQKHQMKTLR
jgi:predicted nuclease of predicted toxin-antitoxin system